MARKLAIRILVVLLVLSVLLAIVLTAISCFSAAVSMDVLPPVWIYVAQHFLWTFLPMAGFSLVCAATAYLLADRLLYPFYVLMDDVKAMAAGDMEVHSKYYARQDEVGMLARAFNGMRTTLKITLDYLEKQVEERTASMNMIIDSSPYGLALVDHKRQTIVRVNNQLCAVLGYERERLVGAGCRGIFCARQECAVQTGERQDGLSCEKRLFHRDGHEIDVLERSVPVTLDGTLYNLMMFVDITEQKKAHQAVADSERQYRDLIQNLEAGVIVFNHERQVLMINRVGLQSLGMAEGAVVGRQIPELDWGEIILEDGRVLEDQRTLLDPVYEQGLEVKGQLIGVQAKGSSQVVWMLLSVLALKDTEGKLERVLLIASDVTELKQMRDEYREMFEKERRLQDEVARAHSVIQKLPHPTVFVDQEGMAIYANRAFCEFFDVDPARVRQLPLTAFVDQEEMAQLMLDGVRAGINCSGETMLRDGAGVEHPVHIQMVSLKTDNDEGLDVAIIMTDLTEKREAEQRQKLMENRYFQAQKLESIGQLAAGIAHEINTPSQFVGDNLRFLKDSCTDISSLFDSYHELIQSEGVDGSIRELFQKCDDENDLDYLIEELPRAIEQSLEGIQRISGIVQAMKEFSHPGSGEMQAVNINHAINNTLEVARNEWKYHSEVRLELDEGIPLVSCRAGEINQVLLNLIVNAAHAVKEKFSVEGMSKGEIVISTKAVDGWMQIEIADNGAGIPEEIRERVFDPFFTTKGIGLGTGQGLAIVYDVIRNKHGGEVSYESEVGQGTRFVIRLPLERV